MKRNAYLTKKIYESHHGPVPLDHDGRSYEIHHIDGNHQNNHISNLTAVSIQEHYNIHRHQNDWQACQAIAIRMKKSPDEISTLARNEAYRKLKEGIHPFQRRPDGTSLTLNSVANGTNPFLKRADGTSIASDRVKSGTHNLLKRDDGTSVASDRIAEGTHHFCGDSNPAKVLVKEGKHHLQGKNHHNFDQKIYEFEHESGIKAMMLRSEFTKIHDIPNWLASRIVKNPNKSFRGWKTNLR